MIPLRGEVKFAVEAPFSRYGRPYSFHGCPYSCFMDVPILPYSFPFTILPFMDVRILLPFMDVRILPIHGCPYSSFVFFRVFFFFGYLSRLLPWNVRIQNIATSASVGIN